jgi:hypothetical protein
MADPAYPQQILADAAALWQVQRGDVVSATSFVGQ